MTKLLPLPLILIFALPLALALAFITPVFVDGDGFAAILSHPQFWGGLSLSLFTGLASTLLSLIFAILIVANSKRPLATEAGAMLALPHLALAIGLVFLLAPTGVVARLIATLITGWNSPPQWIATQDPFGLSLIAALVLKETPFLVWAMASLLNRNDLKQQLNGHARVSRSLGHGGTSIWLRILLPQLLPRMIWPLIAVFTYSMTVVDMALVIGPTQPPTLATIIWRDLNDAEIISNGRGAAGVLGLSFVILCLLVVVGLCIQFARPYTRVFLTLPPVAGRGPMPLLGQIWGLWRVLYSFIVILLLLQIFAGPWPFPQIWPSALSTRALETLLSDPQPMLTSLVLAIATATLALAAAVAWLEATPPHADRFILAACVATLCLPALLLALGQYRLFLSFGITGTALALFLAHVLPVAAYVFVMLHGPYRGFDPRWRSASAGLGQSRLRFLTHVKWPLLKAPLLSAWAVGFAVSMAQFVPAQLAAAGRYTTLAIETVTLSSGGNRGLLAASAVLLMLLPLIAFVAAGHFGKPRWRQHA